MKIVSFCINLLDKALNSIYDTNRNQGDIDI